MRSIWHRKLGKSSFNIIYVEPTNKSIALFLGLIILCFKNVSVTNLSRKLAQTKYVLTNTDRFAGPLRCAFLPWWCHETDASTLRYTFLHWCFLEPLITDNFPLNVAFVQYVAYSNLYVKVARSLLDYSLERCVDRVFYTYIFGAAQLSNHRF